MTVFECPRDGCDYEGDSLPALRSHANARTDHDWSDLKAEAGSKDDGDGSEESVGDEEQEPAGEQTEASQTEEYDDQWSEGDDDPDPDPEDGEADDQSEDDNGDDEPGSTTSDENGSIGSGAALVAGSVLVGLLVLLTKDKDEPKEVPSESSDVPEDELEGRDKWGGAFE